MLKMSDDQIARELTQYLHQALAEKRTTDLPCHAKAEGHVNHRNEPSGRVAAAMRARRLACLRK